MLPLLDFRCKTPTYEGTRTWPETVCVKPLPARVYGRNTDVQRTRKTRRRRANQDSRYNGRSLEDQTMSELDHAACGCQNTAQPHFTSRRQFFGRFGMGLGGFALAEMLARESAAASVDHGVLGQPHFPPKAKRIIYLFMSGGPLQLDLFDYKPLLNKRKANNCPTASAADNGSPACRATSRRSRWSARRTSSRKKDIPAPGSASCSAHRGHRRSALFHPRDV